MLADDIAKVRSYAPPCDRLVGIYLDAGPACVLAIMAVLHAGQAPPHLRQTPVLPSRSALSHALLAEQALVVHAERIFLPLDPSWPQSRLERVLEDVRPLSVLWAEREAGGVCAPSAGTAPLII